MMPRKLSTDPEKRRLQIFRRIYSHFYEWEALVEEQHLMFLEVEGETIYFYDLLVGLDKLPPRQKEAFVIHILHCTPEREASKIMGTSWVSLVGQYSTAALKKMVAAYDAINNPEGEENDKEPAQSTSPARSIQGQERRVPVAKKSRK